MIHDPRHEWCRASKSEECVFSRRVEVGRIGKKRMELVAGRQSDSQREFRPSPLQLIFRSTLCAQEVLEYDVECDVRKELRSLHVETHRARPVMIMRRSARRKARGKHRKA